MTTFAAWPAAGVLTGVVLGTVWPTAAPVHAVWSIWAAMAATVLWMAAWAAWRRNSPRASRCALVLLVVCTTVLAQVRTWHALADARFPPLRAVLEGWVGHMHPDDVDVPVQAEPLMARLSVTEDAVRRDDVVSVRADVLAVSRDGRTWVDAPGGITLTIGGTVGDSAMRALHAGVEVEAPVAFRRPARFLNRGVPDQEEARLLRRVALLGFVKSGLLVTVRQRGGPLARAAARARWHVRDVIHRTVGTRSPAVAAIAVAVLIGDERALGDDARERWQRAGVYHLLAISGGNIAVALALAVLAIRATGRSPRVVALGAALALAAFALVVMPGASVRRAVAMAALALGARLLDHRTHPWQTWAVAVAVLAVADPPSVSQPAMLLTCGATAALVALIPSVTRLAAWSRLPWAVRAVAAGLLMSLAVEVVVAPIGLWFFSRVSLAGPLLNLLAVPAMSLAQGMLFAVLALEPFGLEGLPAAAAATAIASVDAAAEAADRLPALAPLTPRPDVAFVVTYYVALVVAWAAAGRTRIAASIAVAASGAAMIWPAGGSPTAPPLRITMFDVGQAESVLVESGASSLLVDTGGRPFGDGLDIGRTVLVPALWGSGRHALDAMLVTHADPDHVGGAAAVLEALAVRRLWLGIPVPGHPPTRALIGAAVGALVPVERRIQGQQLRLGHARLRVLHPPPADWRRRRVRNDDSVVLEIVQGDVAVLLLGDVGADVERAIVPRLTPARLRVLKVAHHGSATSSSAALVEGWRPDVVLISCGRANGFGHPAPQVLARLRAAGAAIARTDRDGQIVVTSDGAGVSVETFTGRRFTRRPRP